MSTEQKQNEALKLALEAIEALLKSISDDSDNFVGGVERMKLEEALKQGREAIS